jgi:hypothetical protein
MSDVTATDLSQWDDDYGKASGESQGHDSVPDGTYSVNVEKAQLTRSKSDKPMLKWQFRIFGPCQVNRVLFSNQMIASATNVEFLKRDLTTCGLDIVKLSELPARLGDLLDLALEVRKVTKGEYENVYIQKLIDKPAGDAPAAPEDYFAGADAPPPTDDDFPF